MVQEGSKFPMHPYQIHFTTLSSSLSPQHCYNKPSITHLPTHPINLSNARKDDARRPYNGPFMGCAMCLMQGKKEWIVQHESDAGVDEMSVISRAAFMQQCLHAKCDNNPELPKTPM